AVAGGAPSLLLVIEKFPGADTLQVTRDIEQAMAGMAPGLKGITIDTREYRPATFIETALRNAGWAALIGLVLLVLALGLLASWRTALIGAVVVPMALVLAAYVLYLRGTTFTTVTLLGLAAAVCLVIDDVITDTDAVRYRIAQRGVTDGEGPVNVAIRAAFAAARGPLVFAVLAILLATLPFLFLGTLVTAFSRPLVLTFALAVLTSMVVAFTLTPTLAALLLRGAGAGRQGRFARRVTGVFDRGFAAVAGPRRAWAVAGVLAVAALAVIPQAGRGSLLPQLQDRNLLLRVEAAPGTSLPEMDRIAAAAGNELRALPGVQSVGTHVGRAVGSDQLVDVNSAEAWITLDDRADYGRSRAVIAALMSGYPGLRTDLVTYPTDRIAQVMAGQKDDLVVRVYGADLTVLQHKARQIRAMLAGVPGGGPAAHAPDTGAANRGREGQARGRAAVRATAWRCPEGRDDAHLGPDRREPLRAVEDLRRGRLGRARGAQRPDRAREHADRHAFRGACGPQGRRHRGRSRGARRHRARRRAPQRGGGRAGHRRPLRRGFGRAFPPRADADAVRVPRGGVRERHHRAGRHHPGAHLRRGRARRRLPAPAGGGGELAARRVDAGVAAAVGRR